MNDRVCECQIPLLCSFFIVINIKMTIKKFLNRISVLNSCCKFVLYLTNWIMHCLINHWSFIGVLWNLSKCETKCSTYDKWIAFEENNVIKLIITI